MKRVTLDGCSRSPLNRLPAPTKPGLHQLPLRSPLSSHPTPPRAPPPRAPRPARGRAAEVVAPPYDVLTSAEARARAAGKPWSFLHVSKAEIDLDPAIDPYDRAVYAKAAENLGRLFASGLLVLAHKPFYYAY